jgi:transposase
MSLKPHPIQSVPEETARVAHAAFPHGTPYLTFRDELGPIFQDEDFTALFPTCGQPGLPPWRLALVTLMNSVKTSRTAKRRRPSAHALIGSTCWGWSSATQASIFLC